MPKLREVDFRLPGTCSQTLITFIERHHHTLEGVMVRGIDRSEQVALQNARRTEATMDRLTLRFIG